MKELESDLATRSGFAARVVPPAGVRNVGYFIGVLGLLAAVGAVFQGRGGIGALAAFGVFLAPALVTVALGLLIERGRLRPLHARYVDRGWVAAQVPCGLVQDNSGDSSLVLRSRGLEAGATEKRDHATPIVLVGGRAHAVADVEAAATAARDALGQLSKDEAWELGLRVWSQGLGRDRDAAAFLPVPDGMLLTVQQGHSPYVLVIPGAHRSGDSRPGYYAIRAA